MKTNHFMWHYFEEWRLTFLLYIVIVSDLNGRQKQFWVGWFEAWFFLQFNCVLSARPTSPQFNILKTVSITASFVHSSSKRSSSLFHSQSLSSLIFFFFLIHLGWIFIVNISVCYCWDRFNALLNDPKDYEWQTYNFTVLADLAKLINDVVYQRIKMVLFFFSSLPLLHVKNWPNTKEFKQLRVCQRLNLFELLNWIGIHENVDLNVPPNQIHSNATAYRTN